ncbi:MAG: hypothetical protein IID16_13150, partial [Candidatus Marinimicrobia bacterium]|nr:hypothetical protein [Candidatus Neomarinimicrobiota bacterium]
GSHDGSLPVELTLFTALPQRNSTVVLEWVTESEIDNLGFILERRSVGAEEQGGEDWQEIASLHHPS